MSNRKYISSEVDRLARNGLCGKPKGRDAQMLPSAEAPIEKPVRGPPKEDPLKSCVRDLLNQGGRSEEEAEAWCKDFLANGGKDSYPESADGANAMEAHRIFLDVKESLKPFYLEKCVGFRQRLLGESEFEAAKRCRIDYEMAERVRGGSPAVATDQESLRQITEMPEPFKRLQHLQCQLDALTSNLVDVYHYTPEAADKKARKELNLPQVYPKRKPEPDATMPSMVGKTREQRIQELAADTQRRPGERLFGPYSGVPNLYGKSRKQVLDEVYEQDRNDRNR